MMIRAVGVIRVRSAMEECTQQRRRRSISPLIAYLSLSILLSLQFILARGAVSTNGPEDKFFCGWSWDDEDCASRQHCPSGRSEECDGFEEGQKCYANTECDVKVGDGSWYEGWEPGDPRPRPPRPSPGGTERPVYGKSDNPSDHYFCGVSLDDAINKCATHCPTGMAAQCPHGELCFFDVYACNVKNMITPTLWPTYTPPTGSPFSGPTKIPTEMPIPPPEPLDYPSDDLTDHWFCGGSLAGANMECKQHCPTAMECPMGQICFFGTICDARTHTPTPPPTRRPTKPPTEFPTLNPTVSASPTDKPTETMPPSNEPTEQIPTRSPTQSPTKRPTYAPMPSLMSSFFCGSSWDDAINNCKKRCPSSDDSECPFDEHCYSLTPCTEERGYPDSFYENEEGTAGTGGGGSSGQSGACVPFEVTITADYWPKENTWTVENTKSGEVIAEGENDLLIPGEAVKYPVECINDKLGCYMFTIKDSGGDGMCCEHGSGSYTAKYDGEVIKTGSSFYDDEKVPFGLCGVSEAPTASPQKDTVSSGTSAGGIAFRCVPKPLIQGGYMISVDKCMNFVDCYNPHINIGDDWFCDEDAECVEAPKCNGVEEEAGSSTGAGGSYRCVAKELADKGYAVSKEKCDFFDPCYNTFIKEGDQFFCNEGFSCIRASDCGEEEEAVPAETVPPPRPSPVAITAETAKPTPKTVMSEESVPARPIVPRPARPTNPPTPVPTQSAAPTFEPTTYRPTHGPCSGAACNERDHCRSLYGFCGPGEIYCNKEAIWTKDCPDPEPSPPPSSAPPPTNAPLPSDSPVTFLPAIVVTEPPSVGTLEQQTSAPPSTQKPIWLKPKPSGNPKPKPTGGGKPKPSLTPRPTEEPVKELTNEPQPTMEPSASPQSMVGTFLNNNPQSPKTPNPTAATPEETTAKPVLPTMYTDTSTDTDSPSASPAAEAPTNEFECTGDPCPVDIHCRSRYGSCGPGFIYCNAQSIWTAECPPIIPGVTPTRNPTRKPTKSPSTIDVPAPTPVFGIPNIVLDKADPTFPPIPKPTLTVISVGNPVSPSFFEIFAAQSDENDQEESEEEKNEENGSADDTNLSADFSPREENTFESDAYLDAWVKQRDSDLNGAKGNFSSIVPKIIYGVVFSLSMYA